MSRSQYLGTFILLFVAVVCGPIVGLSAVEAPQWVNIAPLSEEASVRQRTANDLAELARTTIIDSVAYNCTLVPEGMPPTDKAAIYAQRYREQSATVKALSPIRQGFLFQATMGHGWKPNSTTPWQKVVKADGSEMYKFCPLGAEFLAYIAGQAQTFAVERPDFFMVDDDTRLITYVNGCYCPLHLAEFARRTGRSRTREQVIADCEKDPALARAWDTLLSDSIAKLMETIRAQFPSDVPGLFCCCREDAHHAARMAGILAAPGQRPGVRINNAWYANQDFYALPRLLSVTARQIADIGPGVTILDEADTCPQNRYSTSATRMIDHLAMMSLAGCNGAKFWITRIANGHEAESGRYYRELLSRQCGYLKEIAALRLEPEGVVIPLSETKLRRADAQGVDWGSGFFAYMGLPYRYGSPRKGEVAALMGAGLADFSDAQLTNLLSGTVLLDGDAAVTLSDRGFGSLLGVTAKRWRGVTISAEDFGDERLNGTVLFAADLSACDPKAEVLSRYLHANSGLEPAREQLVPGTLLYRNALGGTVAILAGELSPGPRGITCFWYYNETRKRQIGKLVRRLNGGALPGGLMLLGDEPALCWTGRSARGERIVVVDNLGIDTIEHPHLRFDGVEPKMVERLSDDGRWQAVVLSDSAIRSFRPAVFRLR